MSQFENQQEGGRNGTWTSSAVLAPADEGVISAVPTTVRKILAANSHATDAVFLQVYNNSTVPANGTAPRIPSIPIAAGQTVLVDIGAMACSNGFSWASSSTAATKTVTALTSLQVSAEIG